MRVNGRHGIREEPDMELVVLDDDGTQLGTHTADDLRALEQVNSPSSRGARGLVYVVTWGGPTSPKVRVHYPDQRRKFVGLSTIDGEYNVGLEMPAMLHLQTMLARPPARAAHRGTRCTRAAVDPAQVRHQADQGIGTIQFSETQPENDYWTERGYDWYAVVDRTARSARALRGLSSAQ